MKRWRRLYEEQKKGVSMAIVLCAAAFFIAFAVAILYTAGLLTGEANERLLQERCRQLAKSYAGVLDTELKAYSSKSEGGTDSFYSFVNRFLDGSYAEYDSEHPDDTIFYYRPTETSGTDYDAGYGDITIALYKEKNEGESDEGVMSGTLPAGTGSYAEAVKEVEDYEIMQYVFTVQVTAENEDESYTYSTEYYRKEKYKALFSHNGKTLIWGEDGKWHEETSSGAEYDMSQVTDANPIQYERDKNQATESRFVSVYEEENTASGETATTEAAGSQEE